MADMDGSSKPPQISEMFQKFAIAFRAKTFEFFADDDDPSAADESEGFSLLDSAEDFIPDQKVVVIKPDNLLIQPSPPPTTLPISTASQIGEPEESRSFSQYPPEPTEREPLEVKELGTAPQQLGSMVPTQIRNLDTQMAHSLISSIFATVSSFEASYLQLQTAHVPFIEEGIKAADKALVSHLQRFSEIKHFCRDFCWNSDFDGNMPVGYSLESQVEENQSKLRVLETVVNRSQSQIDDQDDQVSALRTKLGEIQTINLKLSRRLSKHLNLNSSNEVLLSVRVFDCILHDAYKAIGKFTKILVSLMKKAGWDLDLAANSVYSDIVYTKKGHNRYSLLSYVSMGMFRGFDVESYGGEGSGNGVMRNGEVSGSGEASSSLKLLLDHISTNPMEVLGRNPKCEFSKFCERKYQELIHPTMESSIFSNLDQNDLVLDSWRSLSVFYESFVAMASSIWILHKLAFSFEPVVEIFQVERGVDFSMIYMEDVTKKCSNAGKNRPKVGFTVVPGFKIGKTVIQSQVYLDWSKSAK